VDGLLRDLLAHQLWADVEHWQAIGAHPAARVDKALHDRLHHIHQVQRAFAWIVGGGERPGFTTPDRYPDFVALKRYGKESHDVIQQLLSSISDARLTEPITIPWFTEPPLTLLCSEALAQMATHSHYHRGQNATRLRELGGTPPLTDLIVWYWKGRPEPGTL
jgi:uncharacterized damage-inducible protein DinB